MGDQIHSRQMARHERRGRSRVFKSREASCVAKAPFGRRYSLSAARAKPPLRPAAEASAGSRVKARFCGPTEEPPLRPALTASFLSFEKARFSGFTERPPIRAISWRFSKLMDAKPRLDFPAVFTAVFIVIALPLERIRFFYCYCGPAEPDALKRVFSSHWFGCVIPELAAPLPYALCASGFSDFLSRT
ncbi:MAG: hypothetical protein J0I16_15150 [Rhizobiales bacterium]|nr:hypothetical protein [Hyphomicrobiales bacterium]